MSAWMSWFVALVGVLSLVVALHHLGVDLSATLGTTLHSTEHFLGQPLFSL